MLNLVQATTVIFSDCNVFELFYDSVISISHPRPVARLPSGGCVSERRRREDRGGMGVVLNFLHKNDVFWCTLEMDFILNVPAREGS